MKIAFIGKSIRENELRLPLHPQHFELVPEEMRPLIHVDSGYGSSLGLTDNQITAAGFNVADRTELLKTSDTVVIPKPMAPDLEIIKEGALIWGWLHFVLYGELADICIERKHTVVTWEGMFDSNAISEGRPRHVFSGNNELAGYAGTIHALGIAGIDGHYGSPCKVAVIGYGYAGQASVQALLARGFYDVTVYTQRPVKDVHSKIEGVRFVQVERDTINGSVISDSSRLPFWKALETADVIVNCGGQDPENPFMYVLPDDVDAFDHNCLIIDVSCDPGMGFPFVRTTTFEEPTYQIGNMQVCAVDHTPGYLWEASTWQISQEVLKFLSSITVGRAKLLSDPILSDATEIKDGVVLNKKILSYQSRSKHYPHKRLACADFDKELAEANA